MSLLFFTLALAGIAALWFALRDTGKVRVALVTATRRAHAHQMIGTLILVAHASEIGRVISHLSWLHALLALLLFSIWLATRFDNNEEIA